MTPPMIESSDRGFTINKSLGWGMLVTIVTVAFWFGTRDATQSSAIEAQTKALNALAARQAEDRQDIRSNREELAEVRRGSVRMEQRMIAIQETQEEAARSLGAVESFLRNYLGAAQ
jgi:hypothetical protein